MQSEVILAPHEGKMIWLQGLGVRYLVSSEQTGGHCALVEHPIQPRALAAPLHTHENEDEISYILEGQVGVQVGERVEVVGPGAAVFKPRGVPHAFWNAGDTPARVLELITPGGFEGYFEAAAELFAAGGPPDPARGRRVVRAIPPADGYRQHPPADAGARSGRSLTRGPRYQS